MSGFTAEWLRLREPADAAARDPELTAALSAWRERRGGDLAIVDLASGSGANVRFLAPWLGDGQRWTLVERDPLLLARGRETMDAWVARTRIDLRLEWRRLDLVAEWDRLDFRGVALVTASALLDLTSAAWLERLVERCWRVRAALFLVLSYDGTVAWRPALADDADVRGQVNRHQRTDKGFGPALGPDAAPLAAALLRERGYAVTTRPSPWRLGPEQRALQTDLLTGWIEAARQIAPERTADLTAWSTRRRRWIDQGQSRLRVGHWDLFAWLDQ